MADTKISGLTTGTLAGTDVFPVSISPFGSGDNRKNAISALDTFLSQTTKTLTNKTIDLGSNTLTMTSLQLKTALSDETGSGAAVFANTPTLVTPVLGVATATTINGVTIPSATDTAGLLGTAQSWTALNKFNLGIQFGLSGTYDSTLILDAANKLALRNSTTAQQFNVYNTFTDASNYELALVKWSSNVLLIGSAKAGTGTARQVSIGSNPSGSPDARCSIAGTSLSFYTQAGDSWDMSTAGHFIANADNTYDIGAAGATRPRNVYIAGTLTTGNTITATGANMIAGATGSYLFGGFGGLSGVSDGVFYLRNNANNDFGRLNFGGTTSSFPALKRSATVLQARLADDSTFAPLQGNLRTQANAVAETPTATHTMIITDAGGTAYRVLCVV